ncbi:MAG: hypothetical protein ACR2P2_15760 [Nakamurella sp.]
MQAPAMPPIERTATIRLLIVDGHPLVRWALTHIAAAAPDLHTVVRPRTPPSP